MATLPKELYLQIFAYLEYRYLRAVCETCRTFAALVRPLMFEVLQFRGDAQPQQYYFENSAQVRYPVRVKTVELAHLDEAVEEVLRLGFVRYVKTFKFGPKFYVSGMWSAYGQWVDDEINQETSAFDIGENESDFEEDDEFAYVGLRRLDEARRGRLAKELSVVTQAEQLWDQKIAEQTRKKDVINTALVKLFDQMPKLDMIEIVPWKIDIQEFGIEDRIDDEVEEQFSACKTAWSHLVLLASAAHASNRVIKVLTLPSIDARLVTITAAVTALFSNLASLSFNIEDFSPLLGESADPLRGFTSLMQAAACTLEYIEFRNKYVRHPHLPEIGEHYIEKIFSAVDGSGRDGSKPLVFPHLKTFVCQSVIFNASSLIGFISVQRSLQSVRFDTVYLGTPGYKWSDVARALPPSCKALHIKRCGHDRDPAYMPAYNHIGQWKPFQQPFPASSGWRINETEFDKSIDGEIHGQVACGLPLPDREELVSRLRPVYEQASFERIPDMRPSRVPDE